MKDVTENKVVEIEEVEDVEVTTLEPEESSSGVLGTVVKAGLVIGGAAVVGWAIKNRNKLKARREEKAIAKLEKAGYVVSLPYDADVEIEEEDIEDDVQ